jgi:hypothetical protein
MAVDPELLRQYREYERQMDGRDPALDLSALTSIAEAIGYVIAVARQQGANEVDAVELLCHVVDITKDDLRTAERLLRRLGYTLVADKLRELARKAKKKPPASPMSLLQLAPRHRDALS